MRNVSRPGQKVGFGDFELDFDSGQLRKGGSKLKLQEQPFQVLALLVERAGEVVTRQELRQQLWSRETFVDFEHGLNKAISKIRAALVDSAENPRYIETLPRHGYRFIAGVDGIGRTSEPDATDVNHTVPTAQPLPGIHSALSTLEANLKPESSQEATDSGQPVTAPPAQRSHRRSLTWMAVLLALLAAAAIAVWFYRSHPGAREEPLAAVPLTSYPGYEGQHPLTANGCTILKTSSEAAFGRFPWRAERRGSFSFPDPVLQAALPFSSSTLLPRGPL
jgi:DNA-binding winged helix-turn-helix (wHTH) protein